MKKMKIDPVFRLEAGNKVVHVIIPHVVCFSLEKESKDPGLYALRIEESNAQAVTMTGFSRDAGDQAIAKLTAAIRTYYNQK